MTREATNETTRCSSPDGLLVFPVIREPGEISPGFEGTRWHTHGRILAALSGLSEEEAVAEYLGALLNKRSVIGTAMVDGRSDDRWIDDDPLSTGLSTYKPADEVITFQLRDGTPVTPTADRR